MEKTLNKKKVLVDYIKKYNPVNYNFFCWIRLSKGIEACSELFDTLYLHPFAKEKTRKVYFPVTMLEMIGRNLECNRSIDLFTLLRWDAKLFSAYSEKINGFLALKSEYEKLLFTESYMDAWNQLIEIENKCGYSLWLINQQFGVLSCLGEHEGEGKKLFDEYIKASQNGVSFNLLMGMYNQKNLELGIEDYNKVLDGMLENYKESSLEYIYLKRKLAFQVEENDELSSNIILQIDECYSMIDLYESFIDVCLKMICYEDNQEICNLLVDLNRVIDDFRLRNIIVKNNANIELLEHNERNEMTYKIIEKYSMSRRLETIESLKKYLEIYPDDFTMNQLLVKCCLFENGSNNLNTKMNTVLLEMYRMTDNLNKLNIEVEKFIKIFIGTKYYYKILALWNRKIKGIESEFENCIGRCMDSEITPSFVYGLKKEMQKDFLRSLAIYCKNTVEILLYQFGYADEEPVINDKIKKAFVKMNYLDSKQNFNESVNVGRDIINKMNEAEFQEETYSFYNMERICRRLFIAYIRTNCIEEAINLYGSMYLKRKSVVIRWNLKKLMEVVKEFYNNNKDVSFYKSIYTPIIYEHFYGKSHPNEIIIAYRQFLYYQEKETLVEWIKSKGKLSDLEQYFLSNVCIVEVLKRDYLSIREFKSASELRIFILRKLLQDKSIEAKKCIEELNTIYSKQRMENHINNIYRDKIHIDIENIKEEMKSFLENEFARYQLLSELQIKKSSNNVEIIEEQINSKKESVMDDSNMGKYLSEQNFYLYIIQEIVSNYLTNKLYGLDVYLGTRIRHVYCQQKLFSIFENNDLISKKITDNSDSYEINPYWASIITDSRELNIVIEILDSFSKQMNDMLHQITGEWLQIKRNKDAVGLFDYVDVAQWIYDYSPVVKNSYELVFESVIESLNKKTIDLLTMIRKKIKKELETFFHANLSELRNNLMKSKIDQRINEEIMRKITICSNEIDNVIDEFCKYFYLHEVLYNDFQLTDVIKCNIDIFAELYLDFSENCIEYKIDITEDFEGKYFPYWVDIIGLLFQNAIEHSGYHDYSKTQIQVLISKFSVDEIEKIKIEISNNVNNQHSQIVKGKRDRIRDSINNINNNLFLEKSALEGGSGLYKIARIIKYNFNEAADYSGGIDNNGKFTYTIVFPYKGMEVNK